MNLLEKLNTNDVIIVLADLQPEILVAANKTNPENNLRRAASILNEGAKVLNIPIFLSAVSLQPDTDPNLIEELNIHPFVVRSTAGVFDHEESKQLISNYKRKTIVLGGVATELAVLQAALGARRLGYTVYLLTDLCGGLSDRTEQAVFRQLEAVGVIPSSVAALLSSLMPASNDPKAKLLFTALSRFLG